MTYCPHCQLTNIKKNGKSKTGNQKYKCKDCGKYWEDTLNFKGRPLINDCPLTPAQRAKNYRQRKKFNNAIAPWLDDGKLKIAIQPCSKRLN
jgi:transposase-like protein